MDKNGIISAVREGLAQGTVSRAELMTLLDMAPAPAAGAAQAHSSRNLVNVLYGIGAIIAVVGVGILVAQHWQDIGFAGRVAVSLGISFFAYVAAFFLMKPMQRVVSQVLFVVSAVLAPLGVYVVLSEEGIRITAAVVCITSLALAVVYGVALLARRLNILVFLTIVFATAAYYALLNNFFAFNLFGGSHIFTWATLIVGAAYILIGYGYPDLANGDPAAEREQRSMRGVLYFFGSVAALAAASSFGGIGDLLAIAAIFGLFYMSVYLRSRGMLVVSALFLIGHTIKLTAQYFLNSLGWPVSLIIIGFLIIGIGYATYYTNRKYLSAAK